MKQEDKVVHYAAALAVAIPVGLAAILNMRVAFGLVAFFVFASMAVAGFDWLCAHMRLSRGKAAAVLAVGYTALLIIGAYTLLPLMLQGAFEGGYTMNAFIKEAPELFKHFWREVRGHLESVVSPEMIDKAAVWIQEHLSAIVSPSASALSWTSGFLLRGTVSTMALIVLPYALLFVFAWWDWEEAMGEAIVRSFLPHPYDYALLRWWTKFRGHGTTLFKAMGLSMLIFSFVFVGVLLGCRVLGYPISIPKAVFFGILLGVTGGVPLIGGVINYVTIILVGIANFGFSMIVLILFGISVIVHKLEINLVTPWVIGTKLKFSTIGLAICFFSGLSLWGATILGIMTSLLLLPWLRACKELVDETSDEDEREILTKAA